MSSMGAFVYASDMQQRTPFLFSMHPLYAWPLAIVTSTALIFALPLAFVGPAAEGEGATGVSEDAAAVGETPEVASTEAPDDVAEDPPARGEVLSTTGVVVLIGLLVGSVGLIPMMARRKGMKAMWWSMGGVGAGLLYLFTGGLPLVHPLMVLLALVFLRAQPPAAPATSLNAPVPGAQRRESDEVRFVEAPPQEEPPPPPVRRRPPRRRRRPRQ